MLDSLKNEFKNSQIPDHLYSIEIEPVRPDMPDTDPQTLYVNFVSLFDPNPYLPDRVKIEFSVRSLKEPNSKRNMNSLLFSYFPNQNYTEELCEIVTIQPQCTLIEKILLLHEEYNREERVKMRTDRMSRHYYDLYQLSKQGFSNLTLNDVEFIEKIIEHRKYYSRLKRFDYTTLQIGSFKIIPDNAVLLKLAQDYDIMRTEMIYGNPPSFEEVIEAMKYIQTIINTMK